MIHGNAYRFVLISVLSLFLSGCLSPEEAREKAIDRLLDAARVGEEEVVRRILSANPELFQEARAAWDRNVLHLAVQHKHPDVIQYCVKDFPQFVDIRDSMKQTPLHLAAEDGFLPAMRLLLGAGAQIDARDEHGLTPLHVAMNSSQTTVELLLSRGADVNAVSSLGTTPLHYAAHRDLSMLKLLLAHGASINVLNAENEAPITRASRLGSTAIVHHLLERGATIDPPTACFLEKYDVLEELLQKKELLSRGYVDGESILHLAVEMNKAPAVQIILDRIEDVDIADNSGWTPLHIAAKNGFTQLAEKLIDRGADVNHQEKKGETPLHFAIRERKERVAMLLLKKRADPNVSSKRLITPLHVAATSRMPQVVQELLRQGANPLCRDRGGRIPLEWANGTPSCEAVLLKATQDARKR